MVIRPGAVSHHGWAIRAVAAEAGRLGCPAADHHRPPDRSRQERDRRYLEEGPDLVLLAMNGWGEGDPAWWINLRADPEATVQLIDGTRAVRARSATGEERERLWARWHVLSAELDEFAALRSTETAVVVLEPRPASGPER